MYYTANMIKINKTVHSKVQGGGGGERKKKKKQRLQVKYYIIIIMVNYIQFYESLRHD